MRNATSSIAAILLLLLMLGGTGCFSSANSRNAPERISTTEELPRSPEEIDTQAPENSEETVQEDPNNPRNASRRAQRHREHRQSISNIGDWLLVALIGIGVNVLLAVVLSL